MVTHYNVISSKFVIIIITGAFQEKIIGISWDEGQPESRYYDYYGILNLVMVLPYITLYT